MKSAPVAPFRGPQAVELERLKNRLLWEFLNETPHLGFNALARRAANEAADLAWLTRYPLLVFPVLFEEKAQVALAHGLRQETIRQRSLNLSAEAV